MCGAHVVCGNLEYQVGPILGDSLVKTNNCTQGTLGSICEIACLEGSRAVIAGDLPISDRPLSSVKFTCNISTEGTAAQWYNNFEGVLATETVECYRGANTIMSLEIYHVLYQG